MARSSFGAKLAERCGIWPPIYSVSIAVLLREAVSGMFWVTAVECLIGAGFLRFAVIAAEHE